MSIIAETTFFESIALPLLARGFKVAPCKPRSKEVDLPNPLEMLSGDPAQVRRWGKEKPNANICVYAIQEEGGLCFLDYDSGQDIREAYRKETKRDFRTLFVGSSIQSGVQRGHFYFHQTDRTRLLTGNISEKKTNGWFSFRVKNEYVASIGSIHPATGMPYTVLDDVEIIPMPNKLLDWLLSKVRTEPKARTGEPRAETNGRAKIPKGQRYEALIAEIGRLWQRGSYSRELVLSMGIAWARENFDLEGAVFDYKLVRREIERLIESYAPGDGTAKDFPGWPDPEPLGDDLPPVPPFDLNMLPEGLRPMVEDTAERMQIPPDIPAAAAIVALGGCVGRRASIRPKVLDTGWEVIPNLWGGAIAAPGFMKSPAMQAVLRALNVTEEEWRQSYESEVDNFEEVRERQKLEVENWRSNYKSNLKKGTPPPLKPDATAAEPIRRRLVLMDATPEKLHEILRDNPAGAFVVRDELVGLIAEMDRQGREGQRTFFLQAWNGYGAHTQDRIERGTIHVPNVCLSLYGNIQPTRIRHYLSDMLDGGPSADGLLQRFQVLVWPDMPSEFTLVDRPPNAEAQYRANRVYRLANLPTESIKMRFSREGQEAFYEWLNAHEVKVRNGPYMHPILVEHLTKYRSLLPSLAGLFELADFAAASETLTIPDGDRLELEISLDHTRKAIALCAYLEAHATRLYSCIVEPQMQAARLLAEHIKRGAVPSPFTVRDIYARNWACLNTSERARDAIKVLEEAWWVRKEKSTYTGGRPTEYWTLNPRIQIKVE